MATSSIFHNIRINNSDQAEAFVAALEACEKDPWIRPEGHPIHYVNTDRELSRKLAEMRKRNRLKKQ